MDSEKVIVRNLSNGRVGLTIPSRNYHRVWPQKGAKISIEKEILSEGIYEPGVAFMFQEGILYIDDKAFRQELGLEAYDEEIENGEEPSIKPIIVLEDKLIDRYLTKMSFAEFKLEFNKLSDSQKLEVAQYAIANDILNSDKITYIKKEIGIDVLKAVTLKH